MLAAKFSMPVRGGGGRSCSAARTSTPFEAGGPRRSAHPRPRPARRGHRRSRDGPRRTDYPTRVVRIALRDGRALEETVTIVRGDALNPAPGEEVVAKFLALAAPVVGDARARRTVDAVNDVAALDNVRDLAALCAGE